MSGSRTEDVVSDADVEASDIEAADIERTAQASAPAEEENRPSRRKFFLGAAAVATAAFVPARAAQAQRIVRPRPGIMTRPGAPAAVGNDTLVRLVNRITLGATEEEVKRAKAMGFAKYLEYHLKASSIPDAATDGWVQTNAPTL